MSYKAAVITVSDKGWRGERTDTSGPAIVSILKEQGFDVCYTAIVPDEADMIRAELLKCADERKLALVLTTGGTGFSPRDITPEATQALIERPTPGIPEAMRAESLKITPHGCLSRSTAGIRGRTLIINLPGSEKAARENLNAVLGAVKHGLDMLASSGSADCAEAAETGKTPEPSLDAWLREAKKEPGAGRCGMYLFHNGVVRETAKAQVREGAKDTAPVVGMRFSYDRDKVEAARQAALAMPGIGYVRVWLNSGELAPGESIMLVLIGGDIRPHVVDALSALVGEIKQNCVTETEIYG